VKEPALLVADAVQATARLAVDNGLAVLFDRYNVITSPRERQSEQSRTRIQVQHAGWDECGTASSTRRTRTSAARTFVWKNAVGEIKNDTPATSSRRRSDPAARQPEMPTGGRHSMWRRPQDFFDHANADSVAPAANAGANVLSGNRERNDDEIAAI
jgi:hypothetical protein